MKLQILEFYSPVQIPSIASLLLLLLASNERNTKPTLETSKKMSVPKPLIRVLHLSLCERRETPIL